MVISIRTRLILAFLLVTAASFYALIVWIIDDIRPRYLESMEESMVDTAAILAAFLETHPAVDGPAMDDLRRTFDVAVRREFQARIYGLTKTGLNTRVYVTDATGTVIFDSDHGRDEGRDYSRWNDVYLTLRGKYGARTSPRDPAVPDSEVLYVAAPVRAADGTIAGVLSVGRPADNVTQFVQTARRKIIIGAVVAAAVTVLLGILVSVWVTRPVRRLTAYAQAVRDGRKPPPPAPGRTEMAVLAGAFEEMRETLEGRTYVEDYIQTLTHEMKSPLSAIRGAAELLDEEMPGEQRRRFLANIRTETDRLRALVDRLLHLAALERRQGLKDVEPVDLAELAREVADSLGPIIDARNITCDLRLDPVPAVPGELFLLRQAVVNLLQNAVNFTPPGGRITVALAAIGGRASLTVTDNGPGIPAFAADKVFDRFYSLPNPHTGQKGTGLGLTFVREAALLHGGTVTLASAPDGGTVAELSLPLEPEGVI
jgi:two-component system, OmpR family, sensor histidine kinase CreC